MDTREARGSRRPPPMVLKLVFSIARGTLNSLCRPTHHSHPGALGVQVCANQRELNGEQRGGSPAFERQDRFRKTGKLNSSLLSR